MNGSLRQIDAGVLSVGYVDAGPVDGRAVLLLHGWPYDIYSYDDVVPLLTSAGYRVIVPYLRGFGTTRFVSDETPRDGERAALARDAIALMDRLEIESAVLAGFDWGARTAGIVAALWPERCSALVSAGGELGWWYQDYFATERGRRGYEENRREFNRLVWRRASPRWNFDDATYDRTARSFDNPDHVDVVIHAYRRPVAPADAEQQGAVITVPTITIGSDFDDIVTAGTGEQLAGPSSRRVLERIGHNVPQEAPEEFADAVAWVSG
jgi:pimeloyl-ACP methyl ester carboxylesterase